MYAPVPRPDDPMSDRLEEVMRVLTQSCPEWQVGDFVTPRQKCCIFHDAAADDRKLIIHHVYSDLVNVCLENNARMVAVIFIRRKEI